MFHSQQNKPPWFTFTLQAVLSLCWQWWAHCSLTRSVTAQAWRGTRCWSRSTTRSRWWRWRLRTATKSCHMTSLSPRQYTTLCLIRSVKKPPQKTATRSCHMKIQLPRLYTTLPQNYHYGYEYNVNQGSEFLLMPKKYILKFCTVNLCIDTMYFVCLIQT